MAKGVILITCVGNNVGVDGGGRNATVFEAEGVTIEVASSGKVMVKLQASKNTTTLTESIEKKYFLFRMTVSFSQ